MIQDSAVAQSGMPQIPLVQSTQILTNTTTTTPVVNSQVLPNNTIAATQIINPQQSTQPISYAPVVSSVQQPRAKANVKVVPIYDDF